MKILVTGATGTVGRLVVDQLLQRNAEVRALVRKQPAEGAFPDGVEFATGDLLDPISLEQAMVGVDKLFLLNAVTPDELTQALIPYNLARRQGLHHITYLSVYRVDEFPDVPHFSSKFAAEKAIREGGVPYTILRPGYFMQNDAGIKDALLGMGLYVMPVGEAGIATVDARDIAEAAAISLTETGHEGQVYNLVNGELHSGPGAAKIWSGILNKEINYAGHNFDAFEGQLRSMGSPAWAAFDLRVMFQGFYERGFKPSDQHAQQFASILGHAPRTYSAFASEVAQGWGAR